MFMFYSACSHNVQYFHLELECKFLYKGSHYRIIYCPFFFWGGTFIWNKIKIKENNLFTYLTLCNILIKLILADIWHNVGFLKAVPCKIAWAKAKAFFWLRRVVFSHL